jgi:hypothetical protein
MNFDRARNEQLLEHLFAYDRMAEEDEAGSEEEILTENEEDIYE